MPIITRQIDIQPSGSTVLGFTKLQIQNNAGITDTQVQLVLDRANDLIAMAVKQADAITVKQDLEE